MKKVENLTISDLEKFPILEYKNSDETGGETVVFAVENIPVSNLTNRVVGTKVILKNNSIFWALLGNIEIERPQLNPHLITASIFYKGKWFAMARYHDFDYIDRGPTALENFLEITIREIFPIRYDISKVFSKMSPSLIGDIEKEPSEKLTRAEIISYSLS